jgi:hypothetical protein
MRGATRGKVLVRIELAAISGRPQLADETDPALAHSPSRNQQQMRRLHLESGRDSKFAVSFDEVFASEGVGVIRTPLQAPNANAYCERWIGTASDDCLDWMLVPGEATSSVTAEISGVCRDQSRSATH